MIVLELDDPDRRLIHALQALHHYLTRRVAWDAVTRIATAPVLRTYKAATTLRAG